MVSRPRVLLLLLGAAVLLSACCPRARSAETAPARATLDPRSRPDVIEPSPLLRILREERAATQWSKRPAPPPEPALHTENDEGDADPSEHDSDVDGDEEVRKIVVPTRGLATWADLAAYRVRHAEQRRPRELYATRLLLRKSGPIRVCDDTTTDATEVRRDASEWIRRARPALKACLIQSLAADPRIIVKAPSALVLEQARALDEVVYRFRPSLTVGPESVEVRAWGWKTQPPDQRKTEACLRRALTRTWAQDRRPERPYNVELSLVAFVQSGHGGHLGNQHHALARQASVLGWLHYERGEYSEALEYFRDAYWVFHLAEFQFLVGLSLERLGQPRAAANAFARYVDARPYAPEKEDLEARIQSLKGRPHAAPAVP